MMRYSLMSTPSRSAAVRALLSGTHVEADDDGARRAREQDVALGDRADAAVNDFDLHFAASTDR